MNPWYVDGNKCWVELINGEYRPLLIDSNDCGHIGSGHETYAAALVDMVRILYSVLRYGRVKENVA